jgi:ribose transport system substrate-binding protein
VAAGVEEAKQLVAQAELPVTWEPPPPFDPSAAAGKTVWFIPLLGSVPFETILMEGMQEALDLTGVNLSICDSMGSAVEAANCHDRAVAQQADLVVNSGVPSSQIAPQLENAANEGVPVIPGHGPEPGPLPADQPQPPVVAGAGHSNAAAGRMMAHFVTADSEGTANIVFFTVSDADASKPNEEGFTSEIARLCPNCEVEIVDAPISAGWDTLTTLVPSLLRENPDIDYLVPSFDGMAFFIVPAVHAADATDRIRLVSFNASPAVMELLAAEDVVVADVGAAIKWQGWGFADQQLRVLSGRAPLEDILVPMRLFTANNVGELDLMGDESSWYGDVDYQSEYKTIWGLE